MGWLSSNFDKPKKKKKKNLGYPCSTTYLSQHTWSTFHTTNVPYLIKFWIFLLILVWQPVLISDYGGRRKPKFFSVTQIKSFINFVNRLINGYLTFWVIYHIWQMLPFVYWNHKKEKLQTFKLGYISIGLIDGTYVPKFSFLSYSHKKKKNQNISIWSEFEIHLDYQTV